MDVEMTGVDVHYLPVQRPPAVTPPDSYEEYRGTQMPIIIDNGSTNLRFGFASSASPHTGMNAVAKYKERKTNQPLLLFGDAIDTENGARAQAKTPWEGDVLLNFDALENTLDYAFVRLGLDENTVQHPILMTERLAGPVHSRVLTSELIFEQYGAPSLAFCVDSLMSFYHNNLPQKDTPFTSNGLVVSFNTASTSVIPILNGKGIMSNAKRIPWGASQSSEYLLKLIQLKYPSFPTRVTSVQSNWMLRTFCSFAPSYTDLLRSFTNPETLLSSSSIIQFPYALAAPEDLKTPEVLDRISEKRREQGRKLQEMAAKARLTALANKERDLIYLQTLRERLQNMSKKERIHTLETEGFDDVSMIDDAAKHLEASIKKAKKKDEEPDDAMPAEEPSYPLVDVPDTELDEDGLKEKRKQKLMKAGSEARARARVEKEREREIKREEERKETDEREQDPAGWARKMRQDQESIMGRIKERNRRKAALGDRKSAAAQARMKTIANLASDERVPKKKRKGNGDDMFGADDADWMVYRNINTAGIASDEEEDLNQLQIVEEKLLTHDPTFNISQTHASINTQRSALLSAFRPTYDDENLEGKTRIHLNIERWRVCETWFSPAIAGVDSAGLGEVMQNVLSSFSDADKSRLAQNVFVTGAPSQLPGLHDRLYSSLRPILPPDMPINIHGASDPCDDAWRGMAAFARTGEFKDIVVTRAEYEEWGGERTKRWWAGNWNGAV